MVRRSQTWRTASLAVAAVAATLAAAELGFRAIGYDFSGARAAHEAYPIYYRRPTVAVGSVFFRRPGPAVWRGNVLARGFDAELGSQDETPNPYRDGPEITVRYDADGFRNPETLEDWTIAVAGDSFTELGYLADEDLFTSQLGRHLGVGVKNLGASFTGPLTQIFYLEQYAASPSLRQAVLVFFEGNDLADLRDESRALRRWRATGERPRREIQPQSSLLCHLRRRLAADAGERRRLSIQEFIPRHLGFFDSVSGEVPVTVQHAPPSAAELGAAGRQRLDRTLAKLAAVAGGLGAEPWLVYMPSKRRVLHERLRMAETAEPELVRWRPGELAQLVAETAERRGVHFLDLSPALLAEAARGRLLYNGVWDTHLNREGSHLVGRVLAEALGAGLNAQPGPVDGLPEGEPDGSPDP